jgi:hypothetical protein
MVENDSVRRDRIEQEAISAASAVFLITLSQVVCDSGWNRTLLSGGEKYPLENKNRALDIKNRVLSDARFVFQSRLQANGRNGRLPSLAGLASP